MLIVVLFDELLSGRGSKHANCLCLILVLASHWGRHVFNHAIALWSCG